MNACAACLRFLISTKGGVSEFAWAQRYASLPTQRLRRLNSGRGGVFFLILEHAMAKPVIFAISAAWDDTVSVWSGHCDDIPAAADAPTLDELLAKISAVALDLLPDNHPDIDPRDLFLQMTVLREAKLATVSMASRTLLSKCIDVRPTA